MLETGVNELHLTLLPLSHMIGLLRLYCSIIECASCDDKSED